MALQIRRGVEADRTSFTPVQGEPLFVTDTNKLYIGDGSTAGGVEVGGGGGGFTSSTPSVKPPAGRYLSASQDCTSLSTVPALINRLWLLPFVAKRSWSVNSVGLYVTTASAGSLSRIGIYASDSDGYPTGSPLVSSSNFDCSTTGFKEDTSATLSMTAGTQYWLATHVNASSFQMRAINHNALPAMYNDPNATTPFVGFFIAGVNYSVPLPTMPTGTLVANNYYMPAVYLGVA